jgi:hypothetical protein
MSQDPGKYVRKHIELQIAWCRWYRHLYEPCGGGESPIEDELFDKRFHHIEHIHLESGCDCIENGPPPLPDRALHPIDIELYDLEIYDILTEFRKDKP